VVCGDEHLWFPAELVVCPACVQPTNVTAVPYYTHECSLHVILRCLQAFAERYAILLPREQQEALKLAVTRNGSAKGRWGQTR
jgi:hypothetical protein